MLQRDFNPGPINLGYSESNWIQGSTSRGATEFFYPKMHVRYNKWNDVTTDEWNIKYPTIRHSREITFTNVRHDTNLHALLKITNEGKFIGRRKRNFGSLSWWSIDITYKLTDTMHHSGINEHCCSPVFRRYSSRYGDYAISYKLSDLITKYGMACCGGYFPCLKVLGTFLYKQQVMHVIVIHPKGIKGFDNYPNLQETNSMVYLKKETTNTWIWKPDSVCSTFFVGKNQKRLREKYCRWDHVAFGFYIGDNNRGFGGFEAADLFMHTRNVTFEAKQLSQQSSIPRQDGRVDMNSRNGVFSSAHLHTRTRTTEEECHAFLIIILLLIFYTFVIQFHTN